MRKNGIPALLEAVPANIRYLTGLRGYDYPMCRFVLFFAEGDAVMYEHNGWYHQMPDQAPWIKEWRPARTWLTGAPGMEACRDEAKQFAADIRGDIKTRGLLDEKLGLGGFDGIAREALTSAGIKNIVDSRPALLEARCIKNQDEINCLKMAAAIVDGVWYRIWETLRPGIKDTDLATTAAAAKHFLPPSTWGYKEEVEVLASEIGHGIGMGGPGGNYNMPIINRQWSLKYPQVFEEGMAIAVECREGEHRVGGVRMENMVVVTKDGAQIMDRFPREEILVAPR